jgi:hypothetical protein
MNNSKRGLPSALARKKRSKKSTKSRKYVAKTANNLCPFLPILATFMK